MAMTPYSGDTSVIGKLGTTPQERGLTTQQFKDKFDEGLKTFVEWFNETHNGEINEHMADNVTQETVHGLRIETGTWTPTLVSLYGYSGEHTYSEQTGYYIKIGNLVHINCIMALTAKDAAMTGTYVGIGGIPFSCPDRTSASLHGTRGITLPTGGIMIIPHVSGTLILLNVFANNLPTLGLQPDNIANNMTISVAATYRV
jgi:hypothetical protein